MLEPWPQFSSRAKECGLGAISQTGETTEREREGLGLGVDWNVGQQRRAHR